MKKWCEKMIYSYLRTTKTQSGRRSPLSQAAFNDMQPELEACADFLGDMLCKKKQLSTIQISNFKKNFIKLAYEKFHTHWFPENPHRGTGYRCVRNNGALDPLVEKSFVLMGLPKSVYGTLLPEQVSLFVDPGDVSFRIGESGSVCIIFGKTTPPPSPPLKEVEPAPMTVPLSPIKRNQSFSSSSSESSISDISPPPSPPSSHGFRLFESPSSPVQFNKKLAQQQFMYYLTQSNCKDSFRNNQGMSLNELYVAG